MIVIVSKINQLQLGNHFIYSFVKKKKQIGKRIIIGDHIQIQTRCSGSKTDDEEQVPITNRQQTNFYIVIL